MSQNNASRVLLWLGVLVATGNLTALGALWATDVVLFTGTAGRVSAWVLTGIILIYSIVVRLRDNRGADTEEGVES